MAMLFRSLSERLCLLLPSAWLKHDFDLAEAACELKGFDSPLEVAHGLKAQLLGIDAAARVMRDMTSMNGPDTLDSFIECLGCALEALAEHSTAFSVEASTPASNDAAGKPDTPPPAPPAPTGINGFLLAIMETAWRLVEATPLAGLTNIIVGSSTSSAEQLHPVASDIAPVDTVSAAADMVCGPSASRQVLGDFDFISDILEFVGAGHWLYVGAVSRTFCGAYMATVARRVSVNALFATLLPTALASRSTFDLALTCEAFQGMLGSVGKARLALAAARGAPLEVIEAAGAAGMEWDEGAIKASAPQLEVLEWLQQCGKLNSVLLMHVGLSAASQSDTGIDTLCWLSAQPGTRFWPRWYCTGLANIAAITGNLETLRFLFEGGGGGGGGGSNSERAVRKDQRQHAFGAVLSAVSPLGAFERYLESVFVACMAQVTPYSAHYVADADNDDEEGDDEEDDYGAAAEDFDAEHDGDSDHSDEEEDEEEHWAHEADHEVDHEGDSDAAGSDSDAESVVSDDDEPTVHVTVLEVAAMGGHQAVVEYVLSSPAGITFTLNEQTPCVAAECGHAGLLRWLVDERCCPCNVDRIIEATVNSDGSSLAQLEWACEAQHRCDINGGSSGFWSSQGGMAAMVAAVGKHMRTPCLEKLAWLRAAGAPWPGDLRYCVEELEWPIHSVMWAAHQGCPFGPGWTSETCGATLLDEGIRALLAEAQRLDVVQPPYGRSVIPDPRKVLEPTPEPDPGDVDLQVTDDDNGDDDNALMAYKYEYGFNPLVYLGEWLLQRDPVRLQAEKEAQEREQQKEELAKAQSAVRKEAFAQLRDLTARRRSGVVAGPVVGAIDAQGGVLWAKTLRTGTLQLQLCADDGFAPEHILLTDTVDVDIMSECSARIPLGGLAPETPYHYRVCVDKPSHGFYGIDGGCFTQGTFRTLPAPSNRAARSELTFMGFSSDALVDHAMSGVFAGMLASEPNFCLFLGDMTAGTALSSRPGGFRGKLPPTEGREDRVRSYRAFHAMIEQCPPLRQLVRSVGFLTAWDDSRALHAHTGSNDGSSKAGAAGSCGTGGVSQDATVDTMAALQLVADYWPVHGKGSGFSMVTLSPGVELYVLETRAGTLPNASAQQLKKAILASTATWKLVAVGTSLSAPPGPAPSGFTTVSDMLHSLHRRAASGIVILTKAPSQSLGTASSGLVDAKTARQLGSQRAGMYARAYFTREDAVQSGKCHPIYEMGLRAETGGKAGASIASAATANGGDAAQDTSGLLSQDVTDLLPPMDPAATTAPLFAQIAVDGEDRIVYSVLRGDGTAVCSVRLPLY
ncbi:hypothetical protein JKP88DRAFT_245386 [Tribonema minus]|uniref:Uncharacterized protein n=1 Tax=Tribonema minus TaxID=303371 RepID=A0A836CEG6_9STRA|nr:hypothetical protein JKP88DRAFT_245386 [Tribonema minus]